MPTPANHVWRPSFARTVVVEGFGPGVRGGAVFGEPLRWPPKDPADVLDYVLDVSDAMIGDERDGIATLDVQISPSALGDLVLNASSADGERVVLWLARGQAGTLYTVNVEIGTEGGRTLSRSILLPVVQMSAPIVALPALTDQTGSPIVEQDGTPILIS